MKLNKNVRFSIFVIIFAGAFIYMTSQLQSLYIGAQGDVGPKFFPIAAATGLILCSIGKILTEYKKAESPFLTKSGWKKTAVVFTLLILYLLSVDWFDYLISTPLFSALLVLSMREDRKLRPVTLVLFSVFATAILYVVFQMVIHVTLPTGKVFR